MYLVIGEKHETVYGNIKRTIGVQVAAVLQSEEEAKKRAADLAVSEFWRNVFVLRCEEVPY